MKKRNIVVIGASAGGFEALKQIVKDLPADLDAAILIVWHISPDLKGILPQVLNQQKTIPASNAVDGEPIEFNHIYVAPPDKHLLLEDGLVRVTRGPRENRFRPAVDPLFRSAGFVYNTRVIGVILSGALDDGTAGLWTIKSRGGITVVQDPADAEVPSMPQNALDNVAIDHCVPLSQIAALLVKLVALPAAEPPAQEIKETEKTALEIQLAKQAVSSVKEKQQLGRLSPYACPECHGVLSVIREDNILRYRCHTGHAYSADSLLASVTQNIEDTLWSAFRGIEESVILLNNLGDFYAAKNQPTQAAACFNKAGEAEDRGALVLRALKEHEHLTTESIKSAAGETHEV